jgi:type II secretory ATPase GspE/PulE/Tfp pilus assembly ATPase PilB-like protein
MCPDQFAAISSIELVVNQRLMRRLCADCGGDGCDVCLQTGYRGRVPIAEIVKSDDRFKQTLSASGAGAIKPKRPLREAANALRETGVVNDAELRRIFGG